MAKKKLTIKLSEDEINQIISEDHSDFYQVHEDETNWDSEKGCVDVRLIVGQESTGKLFELEYVKGLHGNRWIQNCALTEVFAYQRTITTYE